MAKCAISQRGVPGRTSGSVQTLAKFSWCKARKFFKLTAEVTVVEIAQPGPDLFNAQKRFRQHPLRLFHTQCPHVLRRRLGHLHLEKVTEARTRHIYGARYVGD